MKTLYLIDGHAQFFRAYHAIRTPMTSPVTKEPTNATFGFVGMLFKLLRSCDPDYLAVVIDASGDRGTFRSEIYPEYKANRDEPPESLGPQVDRCVSLLEVIGAPVLAMERVEADDVIATLARRIVSEREDVLVRIVSKDKDLQQLLVPGRVEMYDVHKDETLDTDWLKTEKGIEPSQVVDMLTLMGDSVDNVPGVEGIGPKTAAQLIAQWGSLDELMAHADEIKGKRGERLRAAADSLPLSKDLVTLRDELDVEFDIEDSAIENLELPALIPVLKELGFNRYQDDLKKLIGVEEEAAPEQAGVPSTPQEKKAAKAAKGAAFTGGLFDQTIAVERDGDYECVTTKKQLQALVRTLKKAPIFAIDTETTALSPMQCDLCGISVSAAPGTGAYIPIRSPEPSSHLDEETALEALRPLIEDPKKPKCGHNLKYDAIVLRKHGVALRGVGGIKRDAGEAVGFDSMVASYLVDSSRSSHSMDALALGLLEYECVSIKELIGTGKSQRTFDQVPLEAAAPYAAEDADISLRLMQHLSKDLASRDLVELFETLEMPLIMALAELEWNGIKVDPKELDAQAERLTARIEELREQINDASPRAFNPDSPKQLSGVLFNKPDDEEAPGLGIRPIKKTKTGYSTDVEVLEKLAADPEIETPVPAMIVEYRQLTKLVSTYLVALKDAINPATKRVHASFNQTVAATGRLSSSDPNLQNIPIRTEVGREIRRAFVAPRGRRLITADYSQIELRLLAHLSKDEALRAAFVRGDDIHREVAAQIAGVSPEDVSGEQRSAAKMVNFGIVYGITPFGLARRLGIGDKEAASIIADYKARFPGITTFLEECVAQAKDQGYVETMMGRRRAIPEIDSRNPNRRALSERMAINSVVQGSAADLIKLAMVNLHRSELAPGQSDALMLLQIHDELVFEASSKEAEDVRRVVVERMEGAMELEVPLKVDSAISANWFEGK